jgi:hypothetical protein
MTQYDINVEQFHEEFTWYELSTKCGNLLVKP